LRSGHSGAHSILLPLPSFRMQLEPKAVSEFLGGSFLKTFDLFRELGPRQALWLKDFEQFEEAQTEMKKMAAKEPGRYFVYDEDSGTTISRMNSEDAKSAASI
jgi:hypothetical protein